VASTFSDQKEPSQKANRSQPRGLLPVPPQVAEHVDQEAARAQREYGFALTPAARQQMLHDGTLDWYYRDQWVSYRETADGVEVLAVGLDEVGGAASRLTEEERRQVKTKLV
jgi:hypothetical protein